MAFRNVVFTLSLVAGAASGASASADITTGPSPSDSAFTRYCMRVGAITGSRVETIECWTRAEWAEQGVDLDKDWPKEGVSIIA